MPTIVVCDSQPHIRAMLSLMFRRDGYETRCLSDGAEVAAALRAEHVDVVVLNTELGSVDGYSVCRDVRRMPDIRQPHMIMLTADGQDLDRKNALSSGFDEFRYVPFSPSSLLRHVRRAVEGR